MEHDEAEIPTLNYATPAEIEPDAPIWFKAIVTAGAIGGTIFLLFLLYGHLANAG